MEKIVQRHIVCVGDSITRAQVSTDYVAMLRAKAVGGHREFTNAGVNGDLAFNVLRRLDGVIGLQPDAVTVLVGTNDANASMSEKNTRKFVKMKKLPTRPTIDWYRANLSAIVARLTEETAARVALLSLPVLGEEIGSESMNRSAQYSAVVKDVAQTHDVAYLPLHERQIEYLQSTGHRPGTSYRDGRALSATAAMQHFVLRRSFDDISRRRGLQLTTDTIHQNTRGATMIAELIDGFIA
jgi:lysophospholipase L1-like esterase